LRVKAITYTAVIIITVRIESVAGFVTMIHRSGELPLGLAFGCVLKAIGICGGIGGFF